jgi:hypothetical protein
MKIRLLLALIFSFIAAVSASAQNRTVTNESLEKYRQKRVAAERELRENYERLGFPSPEELEKQIEKSRIERAELSAALRAENLEREKIALESQLAETQARNNYRPTAPQNSGSSENDAFFSYGYAPYGLYNFPNIGFGHNRFDRGNFRRRRNYDNHPRIEYRNNLPVVVQPSPPRILAPRQGSGGRRN